jgi:membrane fusion protein, multidrug efflux system
MAMRRGLRPVGCVFAVTAGLVATVGLSGCAGHGAETKSDAGAVKTVPVTVTALKRRAVERTIEVVGTLKGWEDVNVGAKKAGRVLRVLHDMGDHVRPGEKLVELDSTDARLGLAQAQSKYLAELTRLGITKKQAEDALARFGISEELLLGAETTKLIEQTPVIHQATVAVEKAQNNLNRQRNLTQRGAGTVEELQNYENDYKAARATKDAAVATARNIVAMAISAKVAIDVAEQSIKDLTVVAPDPSKLPEFVDRAKLTYGITKRSAAEGQMLKDGDPVMQLVIETPLRLWASVPERHSADVKLGQPVRLTVASFPGKTFDGKVARINPQVDAVSRTFQVETVIPNEAGMLRPGGFAKASILTQSTAEALVVPIEAVLTYAGVTKVFVVEDGAARAVNVETGIQGAGWVEVTGKLQEPATIVTTGQTQLADGTPVVVRTAEPSRPNDGAKAAGHAPVAEDAPKKAIGPGHSG